MKYHCCKCPAYAVWHYMPSAKYDDPSSFYCDDHIPRGCSCNEDINGHEELDQFGRSLPCIEYDFSEEGYEITTLRDDLSDLRKRIEALNKELRTEKNDDQMDELNFHHENHDILLSEIFEQEKLLDGSQWELDFGHSLFLHCETRTSGIDVNKIISLAENEIPEEGYYFHLWKGITFYFELESSSIFFDDIDSIIDFSKRFGVKISESADVLNHVLELKNQVDTMKKVCQYFDIKS